MKRSLLTICTTLICLTGVLAQKIDRTTAPKPGPAPKIQLGNYESFTLDNGLKVFVVENHKIPRVSWQLILDKDPILEGDKVGYVSMAGNMLRRGTLNRDKQQIDEEIDFIGGNLSTSASGVYGSALKKHNEKLLELMSDVLLHPSFPSDELEKLKRQTISGLKNQKTDPGAISRNVGSVLRYGKDHPYGEVETEESVSKVTPVLCKKYYDTYFQPGIAYMAVVGDITKEEAEKLANKYFAEWKNNDVPEHDYTMPVPPKQPQVVFVDKPGAVQSSISITYPVDLKPGSEDAIAASVMNGILGSAGFMARLIQNLREGHAYTYGAYSRLHADELVGYFTAMAEVRNEVTDSAITQFLYEMKRIVNEPVSDEDLTNIKNYLTGSFGRSLERPQTMARFALNIERFNLPKDYYATYLEKLNAVTVADVQRVAKKYIKPENCYILVVGNKDEVADKLKKFSGNGKVDFRDNVGNKVKESKPIPEGVTAQTVLDKFFEAKGGKKALSKIKSQKMVMTSEMAGRPIQMTRVQKAPDKMFMELKSGEMALQKTIINGDRGKQMSMMGGKDLTAEDIKDMQEELTMVFELKYEELGYKTRLISIESINGKDAYKMEVESPAGDKSYDYFDVETGHKVKTVSTTETPRGPATVSSEFSDFKEVDGITIPFHIVIDQAGQVIDMTVVEAEINGKVDKKLFNLE